MPGNTGWTRFTSADGSGPSGETPRLHEARAFRPSGEARLRIVYNRDREESTRNIEPRPPSENGDRPSTMLDRNLQGKIGRVLREVFAGVAEEPVPERFIKLLEALEAREKGQ